MPSLVNLLRNSKVFYTTLSKAQAQTAANITPANTFELQVLSDFKFSQATEQQTITLNEAGDTPARGQRSFNTKINPVDWNFGTYLRPYKIASVVATATTVSGDTAGSVLATVTSATSHGFVAGDVVTISVGTPTTGIVNSVSSATIFTVAPATGTFSATALDTAVFTKAARVTAPESLMWNALVSADQPFSVGTGTSSWVETTTSATLQMAGSNKHRFTAFGLIFKIDNTTYYVDNCAVNQGDLSFGIDAIALVNWTGQGTELVKLTDVNTTATLAKIVAANTWDSVAPFITNKLSTVALTGYNINGTPTQAYQLAITGGQLTINNNIQYLTPETLGAVNQAIGYFSGTRAISGNVTCYLKVKNGGGDKYTSELLDDLIAHSLSNPDNLFQFDIGVGAAGALVGAPVVTLRMPTAVLQIPNIDVQDVVSATINFTAQGSNLLANDYASDSTTLFDISGTNELQVEYKIV